jgi:glycosyltransferase involved in cell wall biosynthesis
VDSVHAPFPQINLKLALQRVDIQDDGEFSGQPTMKIHLHAPCWNEEPLLPFFLKHYRRVVDEFFVYDDGSTDASRTILGRSPNVHVVPFTSDGSSYVEAICRLCNHCWKLSRGTADWVVVCNVDEHLYHPDGLRRYLQASLDEGVTAVPSVSYEMVAHRFPRAGSLLSEKVRRGVRADGRLMSEKLCIFNPIRVEEIHYSAGRHEARPKGDVVWPMGPRPLLLHYKYLGLHYVQKRYDELNRRRRCADVERNYGFQYAWANSSLKQEFDRLHAAAVEVVPSSGVRGLFRHWFGMN